MKKGLFALALGTFALGMAEFIIEGILTDVAHGMGVSIPEAGHHISVYALGVCAGAFSLIALHTCPPKRILVTLAALIAVGAFLGGIPMSMGLGYGYPALIAVPMALTGALCLLFFHRRYE